MLSSRFSVTVYALSMTLVVFLLLFVHCVAVFVFKEFVGDRDFIFKIVFKLLY